MDDISYSETTKSSEAAGITKRKSFTDVSSCHTPSAQFFRRDLEENKYVRITRKEYLGDAESTITSSTSENIGDTHEPDHERSIPGNVLKRLDSAPEDWKYIAHCPPAYGWFMAKKLSHFVRDPSIAQNKNRLLEHFRDFIKTSENGYKLNILQELVVILHYLCDNRKIQDFNECLTSLLKATSKPIILDASSEIVVYFPVLQDYVEQLGYLAIALDDDEQFALLARGIMWQLLASNKARGANAVCRGEILVVASRVLLETSVRMIAVTSSERLPVFLKISLLLGYHSEENCLNMMKFGIIENIFIRFNPYFNMKSLPYYEINPVDPHHCEVRIGDGNKNIKTIISLLLIILEKVKTLIDKNPNVRNLIPCPDSHAQRCFLWGYRYECRIRGHNHERNSLTILITTLLHVYGEKLAVFGNELMADILSLSIHTDLSYSLGWLERVSFSVSAIDVKFKKYLIQCSVLFIKTFPYNRNMIESRHWLLGLMYLIDPDLSNLRVNWSSSLYAELRKIALQALICTLSYVSANAVEDYYMVRRMLWYVEWYTESPYELSVLYWSLRFLHVMVHKRPSKERRKTMRTLFDTHGIVVIINLCHTLMEEPLVEKRQTLISICLQIITSAIEMKGKITCCVYPGIIWPGCVNALAGRLLSVVQDHLTSHTIFTDRWLIAVMNFVWETIIWNDSNRKNFVANNGIYKLLDIITLSSREVQCIALALICDVVRAGEGIGHLVTWRANIAANSSNLAIVNGGSTIARLLARLFHDDCKLLNIKLDERGIIQDLVNPLSSVEVRNAHYVVDFTFDNAPTVSAAAADLAGSRMSKVFALLQMLSSDLEHKVALADEAYKLYKNISLDLEDESILILCSHYLTLKISEAWTEVRLECPILYRRDNVHLEEFLELGRAWTSEIKRQQEAVYERNKKKEEYATKDFFSFLSRIRLNIALDTLRDLINIERPISTMKQLSDMRQKSMERLITCESLDADQAIHTTLKVPRVCLKNKTHKI